MVVLHSDSSPRRLPSACLPGLPLAGRLLPFPFERCRGACPVVRPQVRSLPFPACRLFGEQPRFQTCQFFRRTLPDGTVVASDGGFRVVTGEVPVVLAQVVVPPQPGDTGKVLRQPVLLHLLLRYFPLTVPAVAGEPVEQRPFRLHRFQIVAGQSAARLLLVKGGGCRISLPLSSASRNSICSMTVWLSPRISSLHSRLSSSSLR